MPTERYLESGFGGGDPRNLLGAIREDYYEQFFRPRNQSPDCGPKRRL